MRPELHATLSAMLAELESHQLSVWVAPAPHPRHIGHGVRVVCDKNPAWYRRLCAQLPSSRRDQNRHGRTLVKRRETIRAIRQMLAGAPADTIYRGRILNAARAYWRANRADLTAQLAYAS